jgi:cytochrome c biogenesis protein CcdA
VTAFSLPWVAFMNGVAASLGPCLAPRYAAVAAQISTGASGLSVSSFLAGCIGGYIAFASGAGLVDVFQVSSHVIYAVAAAILIAAGCRGLISGGALSDRHGFCTSRSFGARFLGGLCCSLFGTPCCMPLALALGAQSSVYDAAFGAVTLAAFGAGQVVPLAAVLAATRIGPLRDVRVPAEIPATIGGTLLIAVGALYGALA